MTVTGRPPRVALEPGAVSLRLARRSARQDRRRDHQQVPLRTLLCLFRHREQWDAICADPSLIGNAVEEVLRFESSQISWRRITTTATTVGGYDVPAGTPIFLNFASANRQPDIW